MMDVSYLAPVFAGTEGWRLSIPAGARPSKDQPFYPEFAGSRAVLATATSASYLIACDVRYGSGAEVPMTLCQCLPPSVKQT